MTTALDRAELALRHFAGEAALAGFEEALANGDDPDGQAGAGRVRALWLLRRWDEARDELSGLMNLRSLHTWLACGYVTLGQPDYAAWLATDCGSAFRQDVVALAAFKSAVQIAPGHPEAVAGYATALRMAGRVTEARQYLRETPESAPVEVELAMCAAELDDHETAARHARRALQLDPDYLHAQLVLFELARRTRPGSAETVTQAEVFAREHPVPVIRLMHAWTLYDRARNLPPDSADRGYVEAMNGFRAVSVAASFQPRAILGMVRIELDTPVMPEVTRSSMAELVTSAREIEPSSPVLRRCEVELTLVEDDRPQRRLMVWDRVLEVEPRDLDARLGVATALAELDRVVEARAVVDALRAELPGTAATARALARLETPWRMPEADNIRTRVERPWETGRDDRAAVLDLLVDEVVDDLHLSSTVADRLRVRLDLDGNAVYRPALDDEQAYLAAIDQYHTVTERARHEGFLLPLGTVLGGLGWVVALLSVFVSGWLLLGLAGQPSATKAYVLFPVAVAFVTFLMLVNRLPKAVVAPVLALAAVAAAAGPIWLFATLLGPVPGAATGLVVCWAVAGMVVFGNVMNTRFTLPPTGRPQAAFDRWVESLYGRGVLPAAAEASSSPETAYRVTLPAHCRILSETAVELDTPATRELRRLLRQRGRGSFALAGPRGVGKSTLMERWCAGDFLQTDDDRRARRNDLAVKVDAPVGYQSQEFLHHLFGQVCGAVDSRLGPAPRPARWWSRPVDTEADSAQLRLRAAEERENIRYIQSRTTEGELSLGVSMAGAKGKVSVRRDDIPLNHPELVGRFRDFLRAAAEYIGRQGGKVLIGIDELDRISNGDDAQRFINELKAVFNVQNCYFLVAVSEDALADFELAAMGTRTVFDSAFDTIVRVDYLGFAQARALLNRRIIDLPEQFAALAYVVSGGLARELARTAEEIGDDRITDNRELTSVTAYLVRRQLSRTTRAAADRLSRSVDRREGAVLIPVLDEHPRDAITVSELRTYATRVSETGKDDNEPNLVASTRLDVEVMVRYLAVLLQVFNNELSEERMTVGRVRGLGDFETLARVRRYLGANPYGALELLGAFAKAWGLD